MSKPAYMVEFGPDFRFEQEAKLKASTLTGAQCQDIIDVSDMDKRFGSHWTTTDWRNSVAEKVIECARDGQQWACEWVEP